MTIDEKRQIEDTWFRIGRMSGLLTARELARDIQDKWEERAGDEAGTYSCGARDAADWVYEAIASKAQGLAQGYVPDSREAAAWDNACTIALIVDWLRNCAAATEAISMAIGIHDAKSAFEYAAKTIESGKFLECGE
jgi:hypothetical protein